MLTESILGLTLIHLKSITNSVSHWDIPEKVRPYTNCYLERDVIDLTKGTETQLKISNANAQSAEVTNDQSVTIFPTAHCRTRTITTRITTFNSDIGPRKNFNTGRGGLLRDRLHRVRYKDVECVEEHFSDHSYCENLFYKTMKTFYIKPFQSKRSIECSPI